MGVGTVLALLVLIPATTPASSKAEVVVDTFQVDSRSAPGNPKAPAKVTVRGWNPGASQTGKWSGVVKSEKNECQKGRYVELFRRAGKENFGVGNTITEKQGQKWVWELPTVTKQVAGKYFAYAYPTDGCKRAESEIFNYPQDNRAARAPF